MHRIFTIQDQLDFARISGDYNPLHVDAIGARRTMFGAPVVHGIHMVLWALDEWLGNTGQQIHLASIQVMFQKPVRIDTKVSYRLKEADGNNVVIDLEEPDGIAARIVLEWKAMTSFDPKIFKKEMPEPGVCEVLSSEEVEVAEGSLPLFLDSEQLLEMFPSVGKLLEIQQIAELLASTRMVGMKCPGLQSVYSKLVMSFNDERTGALNFDYKVTRLDARFRMVTIRISGSGMKGSVIAFLRPPQKDQENADKLESRMQSGEFAGQRALVVGGTRGLGEVTAKLLARGGAAVIITYYRGEEDANRVVQEITTCGGVASAMQFNVLDEEKWSALPDGWTPSHLYYFATPFIFSATRGVFSQELYDKFTNYYVTGFSNLVTELSKSGLEKIFYPSSVAVDELPLNMGEYASAKIAGEMLCRYLVKSDYGFEIYLSRLPRMDTDQTASILPVENLDPVPLMLGILRGMKSGIPMKNDSILSQK